jgi:hypothetical protein
MMVLLNKDRKGNARVAINVRVIRDEGNILACQLPDGNVILRKKSRDLPKEKGSNAQ